MDSDSDLDSDSKFDIPPVPIRKKPIFQTKIKVRTAYRQEKIINYLLWHYKITKTKRTPKEIFYYPKRQTSILEYMDLPYNIIWYKGLDIFEHKDYLTNEQEEVVAVKKLEGSDYETWDTTDDELFFSYLDYFDECLYGHDLDCPHIDNLRLCDCYWEMEDEYDTGESNFYYQLGAIVDEFIQMKPQPYERFELGIFCLQRIRNCNRFFEITFHSEYGKILKEFAQFKCSQIKDELLAAVYHPDRIMRLLARGCKDDIVKCYGEG